MLVGKMEQQMPENMDTLLRRIDGVERNASDISRMITELVANSAAMDARVRTLENIQQDRRVSDVARSAREEAMEKDIRSIETRMAKIETGINKLLWGLAGSVGIAFVGWILRGGLGG